MYILMDGLQSTFPNAENILKTFLTMVICNESEESSFSVLKRVNNCHHITPSLTETHLSKLPNFLFKIMYFSLLS
jgi:hypothetical protein